MRRNSLVVVAVLVGLAAGLVVAVRIHQGREELGVAPSVRELGGPASEQERELERIATLGYIAGRAPSGGKTGVVVWDSLAAADGYTLFTYAKGPKAVLIDMRGMDIHNWSIPGSDYWARAHLFENGDLLVITCDPFRLVKMSSDSTPIWTYSRPAHHDFEVQPDGTIWVLVRQATTRGGIHDGTWLLDDLLVHLDQDGRELRTVSLLEAFERSPDFRDCIADSTLPDGPDIFHTNSLQVLDGGRRALVSIRELSAIAVVDLQTGKLEWLEQGPWRKQHEARLLRGRILLFDNLGMGDQSRVLEVDPSGGEVLWSYTEPGFFSRGAGAEQRLDNGNTLIAESEAGRIVEVDPAGVTVWEYINPLTVPDGPGLTLGIMRAERLPVAFPLDWAGGERTPRGRGIH